MRREFVTLLVLTLSAVSAQAGPPQNPDPKLRAEAIAAEVMQALGGHDAWRDTRYLRFDFAVERAGQKRPPRAHTWDKWTGRYRVEGTLPEGDPYVVLMNLNTREGKAFRKGAEVSGDEAKKLLERGYGAWINDTYWLLMPYKLRDEGVTLAWEAELTGANGTLDKIALSFAQVGLTPGDRYRVYVNRTTHLVDQWDYTLQSGDKGSFYWKDWKRVGKIMLASDRPSLGKDGTRIFFPIIEAPAEIKDSVFTTP